MDRLTLARLLSGKNRPSILEKEASFEQVWQRTRADAPPIQRRGVRWPAWTGALTALGAALLYGVGAHWSTTDVTPEFQSRGVETLPGPALEVTCVERPGEACRPGETLGFRLGPLGDPRYFAAFSQRPDGTIVWYQPSAEREMAPVPKSTAAQVLDLGVVIDAQHPPGEYSFFVILAPQAMTRAALKAALGEALTPAPPLRVLSRTVRVAEGAE